MFKPNQPISVIRNQPSSFMPKLFIIMGVSGTGKTTIARHIADKFGVSFLDADDFHSKEAKQYMAANKPLTDEMRKPWVEAILKALKLYFQQDKSVVLAYSGLKSSHRALFRDLPFICHFFCLIGDKAIITSRLSQRKNHFFSSELLDSQFEAMELPKKEEDDVSLVQIEHPLTTITQDINNRIQNIIEKANHEKSF